MDFFFFYSLRCATSLYNLPKDKYSGQFKLRVPKALHKLLSQHAKQEGISMNQYCVYLLTRNDALNAK